MVVLRHKTARHFIHHWMTRMKKGWTTMVIIMITDWSNWFLLMDLFFFLSFLRFGCFRLFFWLFFHNWLLYHFFLLQIGRTYVCTLVPFCTCVLVCACESYLVSYMS